jgi:hypothetical protein
LCESNPVTHNPVKGVKRPAVESQQGKTLALGDAQARPPCAHRMLSAYLAMPLDCLPIRS